MRTSGSRTVRNTASPDSASRVSNRVTRARIASAACRFAVSTSTLSGSAPPRSTRSAATSANNVVFPVPGPPNTRRNPAPCPNTRRADSSHCGRGRSSGDRRTSRGEELETTGVMEPRCTDKTREHPPGGPASPPPHSR